MLTLYRFQARELAGSALVLAINQEELQMASTETTRGRAQDRAKVAGEQDHEVKYEAGKTGASKDEVRAAVKQVGNSRKKVEDKLGK